MPRRFKLLALLAGCLSICACAATLAKSSDKNISPQEVLNRANYLAKESQENYIQAIANYEKALSEAKTPSAIYFELGKLYYQHADYAKAIDCFSKASDPKAQQLLAIAYYKDSRYTDALTLFSRLGESGGDDAFLYHFGLTCEYHNLYAQALKLYAQIKSPEFKSAAQERIQSINESAQKTGGEELNPQIKELISHAPGQESFPQAGAVILLTQEDIEIKADNTQEFTQHYLIKVLNERGKKYGEIELGYDSTYDKITIDFARVIRPDGKMVNVGAKHIRDVSRYMNFPLYSNARAKIISMPEIANDSFIEYQVRLSRGKMVAGGNFNIEYLQQSIEPIQNARFSITVPKGRHLNQRILNEEFNTIKANLKPQLTSHGDKDTYSWELKDIPQIIPEPLMPPLTEVTPVIALSTFESWDQIYRWWWELARDKIEASADMKAKVAELIKGKATLEEKIRVIHNFCAKDIRYVAIEYGQAGHEPHHANEIFSNKYGDCKDKAILLISMLKEIGVKAYPVIIGTKGSVAIDKNFPALTFNHCIVLVDINGKPVFVDPTAETALLGDLPDGDQGQKVFVYFEDHGEIMEVPKFPSEHNSVVSNVTLTFGEDEVIKGVRNVQTFGVFDQSQRYRFRYTMPKLIEESIKERVQDILPGGKLIDYKVENTDSLEKEITLSYHFEGSDFLIKAGPQARVIPKLANIDLGLVSKESRQYAIDFDIPQQSQEMVEIKLPKQYHLKYLPEAAVKETPWFRYENSYQYKDGTITFIEKHTSKANQVEAKDYQDYKSAVEGLSRDMRQCIILERTL